MMKTTYKRFLAVVLGTAFLAVTLISLNKLHAVQTYPERQVAIEAAYNQTGFSPDGVTVTLNDEVLSDADNIPFMSLTGKPIWRVTLSGVNIAVKHGDKLMTNDKIHTIDVYLDKNSLQIIKVTTNTGSLPDSDYYNYDTPRYRTRDYQNSGYLSMTIPQQSPGVTLAKALQSAEDGLGGVTLTPQFDAIYVEYTKKYYITEPDEKIIPKVTAPMRGWFITLKYLPPSSTPIPSMRSSKPSPVYKPARYATVVHEINADTGEWIYAGKTQISDDFLPK
jgi:hypothetical protein